MQRIFVGILGVLVIFGLVLTHQNAQASGDAVLDSKQAKAVEDHDFGDNDPNVFLCMGDSITQGYGISNYAETYPARLQALLGRTVINEGQGGAKSSYGANMINRYLDRYRPGYVLIMFGANDIIGVPNEETVSNLLYMAVQAATKKTIPILATVTPVSGSKIGRKSTIERLNALIVEQASTQGFVVADVNAPFNWNPDYMQPDGLHPNSAGMELIANTFYEKILEIEHKDEGGGSGGCTINPSASSSFDWLLVFSGIAFIYFAGRRYRKNP